MSLNLLAIAVAGIGFAALSVATEGLLPEVDSAITVTLDFATNTTPRDSLLRRQLLQEDELILVIIGGATRLIG